MTLLSTVGDDISRIIPVLFAYKDVAKHHILLCDDEPSNHTRAKTLQKGMNRFSSLHRLGWSIQIITTNEDSKKQIQEAVKNTFDAHEDLWLNATDGYPAMNIILSDMVRQKGGKILSYDHFDNDLHIIEPSGEMTTKTLPTKIDLESYLTMLNYHIVDQARQKDLQSRKADIFSLYANESLFAKVRNALLYEHFGQKNNFDFRTAKEIMKTLFRLGVVDKNHHLIASQQKVLQGGIFEEYLFWLCVSLNPDDIAMGIKIDFDDRSKEPEAHKRVHNEFDIVMMHNNRFYTVECKLSNALEGLEFVYKYDAIIDYFGNASKAIIANISPVTKEEYIGTKASKNFQHSTLRRARFAGVAVYHESQVNPIKFQNLVRNFFHIQ